ncbi:atrial natriuretic peptide-converting enzyme-like isoform X1 [Macrobrachium nipponense]|uniref:atrial natriuretic peptide-converting enzyme-like isoform X1 n=1 Tax=Macrobrachium nipponense TaxID=159736 RepID=UPI0030C893FC
MASNIIRSTYLLGFLVAISGTMTLALPADIPEYEELPKSCESLQGDICQGLGYKETIFPNLLNHESQEEAITDMKKYTPLIEGQCSDVLREFLCALYMPVCTNYGFHLPPCRALCRQVRSGCEEMMEAIGLPWPDKFDCTRFPEHHELMCVMSLSSAVAPRTSTARPSTLIWRGNGFMGPSLTQCVSNADCIFERSVCRAGECVCEYPRTWGPYGCEETQILGGQCSTDEQCSAVTPNAVCSDSVCTCRTPMISYMNLACIHASEVGSLCYNDAQCRAVNVYSFCRYLVSQVVGTCACETDQFINVRGRCSPRLGGRCTKGSCPRQLGAASCQRGKDASLKCFCRKDAVRRRGVCVPQ